MTEVQRVDKDLRCASCGDGFVFSTGEQELYRLRGITSDPAQCPNCARGRMLAGPKRTIPQHTSGWARALGRATRAGPRARRVGAAARGVRGAGSRGHRPAAGGSGSLAGYPHDREKTPDGSFQKLKNYQSANSKYTSFTFVFV